MATLSLWSKFDLSLNGRRYSSGSLTTAANTFTITEAKEYEFTLADATAINAWRADDDTMTSFDFLYLVADTDILIEICIDYEDDVGDEAISITRDADTPLVLAGNVGQADYTIGTPASGTGDVIDRIRIRNDSGGASQVYMFLGKA
jgi:hypothetical protein